MGLSVEKISREIYKAGLPQDFFLRWSAEAKLCYMQSAGEGRRHGGRGGSRTLMALSSSCSQKKNK